MLLLLSMYSGFGQAAFGLSPGLGFSSAYFGTKKTKVMIYAGLQHVGTKYNYQESGKRFDFNLNRIINYDNTTTFKGSLFVPNVGFRLYLKENEQLKTYFNLNLAKPFVSGKMEENGTENVEFGEDVKKFRMFGGEFGFGTEYYFTSQFALGGEFGLRYLRLKYDDTRDDLIFDPNTGNDVASVTTISFKSKASPTYSRIVFNYYF
ncbi:MAG: hypothetical protein OEY56_09465 [Cyclobacteriaceae bacterium]|nr:hypothetical protein [Cyclobacteriaceae bacterium]